MFEWGFVIFGCKPFAFQGKGKPVTPGHETRNRKFSQEKVNLLPMQ